MNLKITIRFIITVVLITMIVIFINLSLGLFIILNRSINNTSIVSEVNHFSPEDFTNEFDEYLIEDNGNIHIHKDGEKILEKREAWIQILDNNGTEVYNYRKPPKVDEHYTPMELVHAYKYSLEDSMSTIFISEKDFDGRNYSYIIGFPFKKIKRNVISYDIDKLTNNIKKGIYTLLTIDIFIALLFGYLFSRRLTKPLVSIINDIKTLSEGEYNLQREEIGIYKQIYKTINNLSSKLRSNEEERKNLDKMREEWISNISHDIKTPLASIKGYAEVLSSEEYDFTKAEMEEYARIIEDKSDYIRELIDDLNLSTRLKNKAITLNLKRINIVPLVRGVVIDILNDSKTSNMDIKFSATREVIEKDVDEILIKRVVTNLLYNAIVHNDENVAIEVKIEKKDKVHILITDNGKGIKEEDLKNIFERYYRGTNTGTKHKGSGLGMAIANDIVKAHDGSINIKSQLGVGTEIEVIL